MIITTNTGMVHGGAVLHVISTKVGAFGQTISLCGRWITPGSSDARMCKTCVRIGGIKINDTPTMGEAEQLIASCNCERSVHLSFDLFTSRRPNGKRFVAFEREMFRDIVAAYREGSEHDACWVGTCMQILEYGQLRADGPKVSENARRGGNGGGNVIDPQNAKPARKRGCGTSEKQEKLIRDLISQIRELNSEAADILDSIHTDEWHNTVEWKKISPAIDALFAIKNSETTKSREKAANVGKPENGWRKGSVYVINGVFHRVHISQSSGRPYTQAWIGESWEYQGMRELKNCTPENKITAEQAAQWGHEHDWCVFCSRTLDDQRSRNAGYGSTCADNYGLPWG